MKISTEPHRTRISSVWIPGTVWWNMEDRNRMDARLFSRQSPVDFSGRVHHSTVVSAVERWPKAIIGYLGYTTQPISPSPILGRPLRNYTSQKREVLSFCLCEMLVSSVT
jgi:hypothetical protein